MSQALAIEDPKEALDALRAVRRRNRIAKLDTFDAFYKAYVIGLFGTLAIYVSAGWFGDAPIKGSGLDLVRSDGPAYLGLLVALAIAIGLRSGSRGGPLAFESAEVRHVLMSPIDRTLVVRRPALSRLRQVCFTGAAVGGAAGIVALRRLPHLPVEWIICGACFGAVIAASSFGIAMIFGGLRLQRWIGDVLALVSVGWAGADAYWHIKSSPFAWMGQIAISPLQFHWVGVLGVLCAAALAVAGVIVIPGVSVEAAERRSKLIGQLHFAATLQDVRTVMVLQRQLAQEHLRQYPWLKLPRSRGSMMRKGKPVLRVFIRRSLQDFFRWPIFRMARLVFFVAVSVLCVWGVWAGTTVLIVPAGVILWIAALDLLEPLAQESDHADRLDSFPLVQGWVTFRHLLVPFIVMLCLLAIGSIPAILFGNPDLVAALWTLVVLAAWLPLGGAALAVMRPPDFNSGLVMTPEITGAKFLWRTFMPPAIAIIAFVPLVFARNSWREFHSIETMLQSMNLSFSVALAVGTWAVVWVRIGATMRESFTSMGARAVGGPDAIKK